MALDRRYSYTKAIEVLSNTRRLSPKTVSYHVKRLLKITKNHDSKIFELISPLCGTYKQYGKVIGAVTYDNALQIKVILENRLKEIK